MNQWPKITVVTPTRNSEKYIEETIRSVIEQDYPNLEYILIDGCSTDGTIDIIKKYEKYITYWESSPDKTMYDAIAKGFDKATGEILGWINSDDLLEPGCLQKVGRHFSKNPGHQVIYFENIVIKDGWWVPNRPHVNVGLGELLDCYIIYQDGVFFKREAYESIGGLNRDLFVAGDYDLWLRLSRRYRLHRCDGHLSCFRLVPGQLSMSNWGRYLSEVQKCRDDLKAKLTPLELKRAEIGKKLRRMPNKLLKAYRLNIKRVWPIKDENYPWAPVIEQPSVSIRDCKCPVCNGHPHKLLFSSPDTDCGDRRIWRVYECNSCNLSFTFPKPDNSTLQELYEQRYSGDINGIQSAPEGHVSPYKGKSIYSYNVISKIRKLFPFLCRKAERATGEISIQEGLNATILEIGCSDGRFLERLREQGHKNLYGVERNKKAAETARSKGFNVNSEDISVSDWPHKKVDVIILNQVLEHVSDPIGFLKSVSRLLTTEGRIYLSLPNYNSFFVDFYGPAWAHWHIPFHFFTASPKSIKIIAEKAGFSVNWLKTSTPIHYAFMSEALSRVGLGGFVSHNFEPNVPGFREDWEKAKGVTALSWMLDPFLRGDCLYVKMIKKN